MEAVGQLAGGIAHDFSNLLTAILGYAQLGTTIAPSGSPLKAHLQEGHKAAQRASELTRQLLAFSRQQIIEQKATNLNDLVLTTHKMLRRLIGADIEIVTIAAPDLGLVRVNPGQIEQVLLNLAINARDAMPDGGKLTIETAATSDLDYDIRHDDLVLEDYLSLTVTDNGTGMTEAVQARVFEPFFTTKEPGKGTGLGLSTCYGIVKQNGGTSLYPVNTELEQPSECCCYGSRAASQRRLKERAEGVRSKERSCYWSLMMRSRCATW
jgi:signal transduction histidine kinase